MQDLAEKLAPYAEDKNLFTNGQAINDVLKDVGEYVREAASCIESALYGIEHGEDEDALRGKVAEADQFARLAAGGLQPNLGQNVRLSMAMSVARQLVEDEVQVRLIRQ